MMDNVEHPKHYCTGSVECWEAMLSAFGEDWLKVYAHINAFKYLWRARHKGKYIEDLKKAKWYIDMAIEMGEERPYTLDK